MSVSSLEDEQKERKGTGLSFHSMVRENSGSLIRHQFGCDRLETLGGVFGIGAFGIDPQTTNRGTQTNKRRVSPSASLPSL